MSNLKERLEQIKDEVAEENGWDDIDEMLFLEIIDNKTIDEICKRYAEEVIKEASDRVQMKMKSNIDELSMNDEWTEIDKQSILTLIEEL